MSTEMPKRSNPDTPSVVRGAIKTTAEIEKTFPKSATPATAATAAKARKGRAPVDPNESKSAKFVRLGRKRLGRTLKAMDGLVALGRGQYEYTPEQANKVLQHLVDGVAKVKVAFSPRVRGSKATQELPEL